MNGTEDVATRPTSTTHPRYPLLWLRGLAAFAVVFFHAYQHHRDPQTWAWPWDGVAHRLLLGTDLFVDMFFVLSAFVLWLPVARTVLAGQRGRPGRVVLLRRVSRLLPLYVSVVVVVWAVTNPTLPGHWQDLVLHLTFTHVYSDQYVFWTNGPAWSLAVEFHFYLVVAALVPLVSWAAVRLGSRRARTLVALAPAAVLAAVGSSYLGYQVLVARPPLDDWSTWFAPLAKLPDFAVGMTLAVLCATGVRLGVLARRLAATTSVVALLALVLLRPHEELVTNWWHPMYALAVAVGMAAIVLHDGPWAPVLDWRPLAAVGSLGYGVYLIHEPVMRLLGHLGALPDASGSPWFLLTFVLVAVPTLALAWVSARTVEEAGAKIVRSVDPDGRAHDYYPHTGPYVTPGAGSPRGRRRA